MTRVLVIATLWLAAACQQPPATAVSDNPGGDGGIVDPPPSKTPGIHFATSHPEAQADEFKESFGLMGQRDIIAVIDLRLSEFADPDGVQIVRFSVQNELGTEHLVSWLAFSTDPGAPATVGHPVGGSKLAVRQVEPVDGWLRLYQPIPIAGTTFTRHRVVGAFDAVARLGAAPDAPTVSGGFEIVRTSEEPSP